MLFTIFRDIQVFKICKLVVVVHSLYVMCLQGILVVIFINNFQSKMMNTTSMDSQQAYLIEEIGHWWRHKLNQILIKYDE